MKAPDKIYLQVCGDCPLEKKECESCEFSNLEGNVTWCIDKIFEKDIVYIRKDALLEWLIEVKSDPMIPMNIDKVIDYIKAL